VGNLVQNAIRHARSPRVAVSARGDADGGALVEVRDWGVGVPEGERERIFGLFERAEGAGRGLGMGLWIARRAAQSLGGTVRIEPAQGAGTVFSVRLPRPRAAPPG
jgi:two-component system sensor histidine kinase MtrB